MKKQVFKISSVGLLWLFFLVTGSAQQISPEEATRVALNFIKPRMTEEQRGNQPRVQFLEQEVKGATTLYHLVHLDPVGFVIVAANRKAIPVIGYSLETDFAGKDLNPTAAAFLDNWGQALQMLFERPEIERNAVQDAEWETLLSTSPLEDRGVLTVVGPLLATTWNQDCYYNGQCPANANGSCDKVYAGCVATAMAQVMKYHNFPSVGTGSYIHHDTQGQQYGPFTVNFGATTYNWANMPNSISGPNAAIAQLLFHSGVAVQMNWGSDGSYASSVNARNALVNHFKYSNSATYVERSNYTATSWVNLLKSEININHPIYFQGFVNNNSGHAWVIDGYDNAGGSTLFHMNWGWGGSSNGWYAINSPLDFSMYQGAIINVEPCLSIQNISFPISSGTHDYEASNYITATNIISSTAKVTYGGDNYVKLNPGFFAQAGSVFLAVPEGCSSNNPNEPGNDDRRSDEEDVDNALAVAGFTLQPNPAADLLNIIPAFTGDAEVNIFDLSGVQMLHRKFQEGETMELDISGFNTGVYLVVLQGADVVYTQKLIVFR